MKTRNTYNNGGLFSQVKSGSGYEGNNNGAMLGVTMVLAILAGVGAAIYFL